MKAIVVLILVLVEDGFRGVNVYLVRWIHYLS